MSDLWQSCTLQMSNLCYHIKLNTLVESILNDASYGIKLSGLHLHKMRICNFFGKIRKLWSPFSQNSFRRTQFTIILTDSCHTKHCNNGWNDSCWVVFANNHDIYSHTVSGAVTVMRTDLEIPSHSQTTRDYVVDSNHQLDCYVV